MSILKKMWAIYAMSIFFILWIILFPLYFLAFLLFPKSWTKYIIWFSHHVYTRLFFSLILVRIVVKGKERINPKDSYIIVSNHRSTIDFMMNAYAFPGVYKFLAKTELTKVPLFGMLVKRLCVLVDRRNPESRRKSVDYLKQTLKEGYSIFLYPEGTRNKTDEKLTPFQTGAFRIAIQTGTPIAIQTLTQMDNISDKKQPLHLNPGKVTIVWSDPIDTSGYKMENMRDLEKKVREVMLEQLSSEDSPNLVLDMKYES